MVGKIFITRTGYDPQRGKHVKDPYLGPIPTLGACRPDIRKVLGRGDHVFVISGRVPDALQFVMAGFEVDSKISAGEAYEKFPDQRLHLRDDGQLTGNVIVNAEGLQHPLDQHRQSTFNRRIGDFIVGKNLLALSTDEEVETGRRETLDVLQDILKKSGKSPVQIVGRFGTKLDEDQIIRLRAWLQRIKRGSN